VCACACMCAHVRVPVRADVVRVCVCVCARAHVQFPAGVRAVAACSTCIAMTSDEERDDQVMERDGKGWREIARDGER
jgi:hypothetical protein